MDGSDLALEFARLHAGRGDIWGAIPGRCVKTPLILEHFEAHLFGDGSIGVYPLVKGKVHWGCSDFDLGYEESWPLVRQVQRALGLLNITSWIEKTKGKGFHLWLYAAEWVDVAVMRNALLAAHKIAKVPPIEVNPKSISGGAGGNGNFVNLPYAKQWVNEGKRVVVDNETGTIPLDLETFVEWALGDRASTQTLLSAASLWSEPERASVEIGEYSGEIKELTDKLSPLAWTIFRDGPLEGRDRSRTLARLAHLMAEEGALTPDEAFAVLRVGDELWGKFFARADGEDQLRRLIENAYG